MKKYRTKLIIALMVFLTQVVSNKLLAQDKYLDKSGTVIFEASEKLFEEVKATNNTATAIYDEQTKQIAALVLIKGFRFKNSLMEEHFNENYIESHLYPKAIFKGVLQDFDGEIGEVVRIVKVKGILKLHGKEKLIETNLKLQKVNTIISMSGDFIVSPLDFDIEIPKIVQNKIAKQVQVTLDFKLTKK